MLRRINRKDLSSIGAGYTIGQVFYIHTNSMPKWLEFETQNCAYAIIAYFIITSQVISGGSAKFQVDSVVTVFFMGKYGKEVYEMEQIVELYYDDGAKKLHRMVDGILHKLHVPPMDKDDFYSLANEVFANVIKEYDASKPFEAFLYTCLYKKFCTEIANRTRDKRCTKVKVEEIGDNGEKIVRFQIIPDERLDAPVGDDTTATLGDMIASGFDMEQDAGQHTESYSEKMLAYLDRLSNLQRNVLMLHASGYLPFEIRKKLGINEKQYADCCIAIHSYRNVSVLF